MIISAVDSGCNAIIVLPHQQTVLFRIAVVHYDGEQFTSKVEERTLIVSEQGFIAGKKYGDTVESALSAYRSEQEQKIAYSLTSDIVVLDGAMVIEPSSSLFVGVSKTSSLLSGQKSVIIDGISNVTRYNIIKKDEQRISFIARFHPRSPYVFRCDVSSAFTDADIEKVYKALCSVSEDSSFLGYPYVLLKADMIARVSNKETDMLNMEALMENPSLYMQDRHGRMHDVLDTLRF